MQFFIIIIWCCWWWWWYQSMARACCCAHERRRTVLLVQLPRWKTLNLPWLEPFWCRDSTRMRSLRVGIPHTDSAAVPARPWLFRSRTMIPQLCRLGLLLPFTNCATKRIMVPEPSSVDSQILKLTKSCFWIVHGSILPMGALSWMQLANLLRVHLGHVKELQCQSSCSTDSVTFYQKIRTAC